MAARIAQDWAGALTVHLLTAAVERAHGMAKPGEVVLFSSGNMILRHVQEATPTAAINFVPWCTPCPNKIMKLPPLFTRKKLRAATARRALGPEMDYERCPSQT